MINVYGYIGGNRVEKSISYEVNSTRVGSGGPTQQQIHVPDVRYDLRYEHSYKNGRLVEMKIIRNDGTRWMRYTYEHSPNERSYIAYDENNEINQKYVFKLDADGNDVERTNVDVRKVYGEDFQFIITNLSFDDMKNWRHRTFTKILTIDGRKTKKRTSEEYREIVYY
ncbi:MAG: hypothetical protein ABIP78_04095 [Pyrinomonadaceae bacterium]